MSEAIGTAQRITFHQAKRYFTNGARILVSEQGHELSRPVYRHTTTHTSETTDWNELTEQVRMWRNRYPNQRYYLVKLH